MRSQNTITLSLSTDVDTPARNVTIPCELGPVRLVREIGRGGMGVVYLGRHQMLDRDVAVKFLLNAVAGPDDPGFGRFLEGARAAAGLEHPGLMTIHHADVVDGIPYLVMQYIDGPALSEVLKQSGPLSLSAWFAVLDAVSEAIGELHDRGIIHRDIKPGNVLLGLDGRIVVTDFGLALARPMRQRGPSSAGLGGTPTYMAPEMFAGEVSLRSDVYALGIMAFHLLTGELPFTGTTEEVRKKHLHEPLPLDPLQRRGLDPAMIEVLKRATHKNPMFRYKTARHFRKALKPGIMTDESLREGAGELRKLGIRSSDKESDVATKEAAAHTPTSTYFDRLSEIAEEKRATREPSGEGVYLHPPQSPLGKGELTEVGTEASSLPRRDQPVEVGSIPGPPSTELPPAVTLEVDVPCAKCDYNLRGLSASGQCPECGEPIASSLRPDRLLFADQDWLRNIVRGLRVLYWAVPAWFMLILVVKSVLLVYFPSRNSNGDPAGNVLVVVVIVGLVLGFFFATAAEPRRHGAAIRWSSRRVARTLGILTILSILLEFAVPFTTSYSHVLFIISQGLMWAFLGMIVTFLLFQASLADRIPDARLARRSRVSAVLLPVFVTLGAAAKFALLVYDESPWDYEIGVAHLIGVVGGVLTVLLIWGLMGLDRKAIKQVISVAVSYDTLFGDIPTKAVLPSAEHRIADGAELPSEEFPSTRAAAPVADVPGGQSEPQPAGVIDVQISRDKSIAPQLVLVLLMLVLLFAFVVGGLIRIPTLLRAHPVVFFSVAFLTIFASSRVGLLLLRPRIRTRIRDIVTRSKARSIRELVGGIFGEHGRILESTYVATLVRVLVDQGRVGITIRSGPPELANAIDPIMVTFEPRLLDEADPATVELQESLDSTTTATAITQDSLADRLAGRRMKRNIRMTGGWLLFAVFGLQFIFAVVDSIQTWRVTWRLVTWSLLLSAMIFGVFRRRLSGWRAQWLAVPGGIIIRRAGLWGRKWGLHLFDRRRSVLIVQRLTRNVSYVWVADAESHQKGVASPNEVLFLLRAWLSPLPPPPVETLSDWA